MKAIRVSEINFSNSESVDFVKDKKLMVFINLLSFISFALFYFIFFYLTKLFYINASTDLLFYFKLFKEQPDAFQFIYIVIVLLVLIMHELIHGLFFYLYTGDKPVFGYKLLYAYAGAPDWYIKKKYFYAVSLSPFILITVIGFIILSIVPADFGSIVFLSFTVNAAGCIGDIWISIKLLKKPEETYINDSGTLAVISHN